MTQKTLSRGIACQDKRLREGCSGFAHEEFVQSYDDPPGSGVMLCHGHARLFRRQHGLAPRAFPCRECNEVER